MNAYFISGIAADRRLFRRNQLPDDYDPFYLDWIQPVQNETLSDYARRLAGNINQNKPFILIGTSLGGIMAVEIALKYHAQAVIIIGSVSLHTQLPKYFRMAGLLKIHKLVPGNIFKYSAIAKHYFSPEDAEDKQVIIRMIKETDPGFIKWGMNAVLTWKNHRSPKNLYHIHGTRDEMFPYSLTSPTHTISKGDHIIVISKADEVNSIIREILLNKGKFL